MRVSATIPLGFEPGLISRLAAARAWIWRATVAMATSRPETQNSTRADVVADERAAQDFKRVILPHLDAAYSLARYLARDATAAEDIVQEAYLKAFRAFAGFRGGDARAWILAITRNSVRDWQARQRTERRIIAEPPQAANEDDDLSVGSIEAIASDLADAEAQLLRDGEDARVRAVIERLPQPLREVLVLREMEDFSYREIADVTGTPIGTVMSRLARARDAFARIWQRVDREGQR